MASNDVTYLFFQRDQDDGEISPSIQKTRIIQHGGGILSRAGSVPPSSLHAGGLPPRSLRAGSVVPARGGIVIATAAPARSVLGGLQTNSTSVRHVIHRPPVHTGSVSLLRRSSSTGSNRVTLHDDVDTEDLDVTPDRHKVDRIRRASITVTTATPAELQHRNKLSRDLLIYRADDFKSGNRHGPGVVPTDFGLSNSFRPSSGTGQSNFRSTSTTQRRASVAGPLVSDRYSYDADIDYFRPVRKTYSPDEGEEFKVKPPTKREYIGDLQSKINSAREQMSRHRTMLDRYLPVNLEPSNDVKYEVENKVNELAYRIPQLDPNWRVTRSEDRHVDVRPAQLVTPYRPLPKTTKIDTTPLPPLRSSFTPKISDVRKRARQVLCKVKGDPRYFDL